MGEGRVQIGQRWPQEFEVQVPSPLGSAWSAFPQVGSYLDFPQFSSALHPAGNVDCVSPDVVLRLPGPDHSRNHRPVVYA